MSDTRSFLKIYKSTIIFSAVKIFQIISGIIRNKFVAILLGPEGIGIIGILSNSINLIQNGAGLGIPQSSVRDLSEVYQKGDTDEISNVIILIKKLIFFTAFLGILITIILAPFLSKWTFGNTNYTVVYIFASIVIGLNIINEGQFSILKGMRRISSLAKVSALISGLSLFSSIPLFYFFGINGIVPSLILTSFVALIISFLYVKKVEYCKHPFLYKFSINAAKPLVKMGISMMIVSFLGLLSELIVTSYIQSYGGVINVGLYKAGTTIITSYFGIILTSMTTDYYPRISAISKNNIGIEKDLNQQTEVGLTLVFPLAITFLILSPFFISIFFSSEFSKTVFYTDFAIFGIIIVVCSDNLGMILLAKQEAKIYTLYAFVHRLLFIPIYFIFYNNFDIFGLGIAFTINIIVQYISYSIIIKIKYDIKISNKNKLHLLIIILALIISILSRQIEYKPFSFLLGFILIVFSVFYSLNNLNKTTNYSISALFKKKKNK